MNSLKHYLKFEQLLPVVAIGLGVLVAIFVLGYLAWNWQKYPEITGATIVTNFGKVEIEFDQKAANTVKHFVTRAKSGYYNGTRIHRVVPGLLIEGGDPLTRDFENKAKWGNGGSGELFSDEIFSDDLMGRGVVAMSNHGPNTNDTQFFILVANDLSWLNGQHTIFAHVVSGMDLVEKISRSDHGVTGIPNEDIKIIKIVLK